MSHQTTVVEARHESAHPSNFAYVMIAVILAVITSIEVAVYYIHALRPLLLPILLVLSATKFAIVAGYYMHLKFDGKLFSYMFGGGLILAGTIVCAIMILLQLQPGYTPPRPQAGAEQQQAPQGGEQQHTGG
jgi:cytochrome c oxidase subunit 4